jgi:REP-associated tyrosine transposase
MHFEENYTYHIYNRSNELVFRTEYNYLFFLKKFKKHILPFADVLAYCLMPNHFHLMVQVNKEGVKLINENHRATTQLLSKNIGLLLSSYTQAINKQENRRGSLFAHKTKAKQLNNFGEFKRISQKDYSLTCFNYIHQNPVTSNLVEKIEDWNFSSFKDYAELSNGTLINKELAVELLNLDLSNFKNIPAKNMQEIDIKMIF